MIAFVSTYQHSSCSHGVEDSVYGVSSGRSLPTMEQKTNVQKSYRTTDAKMTSRISDLPNQLQFQPKHFRKPSIQLKYVRIRLFQPNERHIYIKTLKRNHDIRNAKRAFRVRENERFQRQTDVCNVHTLNARYFLLVVIIITFLLFPK